jgi:hypothetical protein
VVSSPEFARDTVDLVAATKYTAFWIIEYCVFLKDCAHPGIDMVKIAQGYGMDQSVNPPNYR